MGFLKKLFSYLQLVPCWLNSNRLMRPKCWSTYSKQKGKFSIHLMAGISPAPSVLPASLWEGWPTCCQEMSVWVKQFPGCGQDRYHWLKYRYLNYWVCVGLSCISGRTLNLSFLKLQQVPLNSFFWLANVPLNNNPVLVTLKFGTIHKLAEVHSVPKSILFTQTTLNIKKDCPLYWSLGTTSHQAQPFEPAYSFCFSLHSPPIQTKCH